MIKRLTPNTCQGCGSLISSSGSMPLTLYKGKWLCPLCLDKARKGIKLELRR